MLTLLKHMRQGIWYGQMSIRAMYQLVNRRRVASKTYSIAFPPATELISANGREHWTQRAKVTKHLRELAEQEANLKRIPELNKVKIRAVYYPPDNRRRDMSNLFPSVKAAIDGIVDAGVLLDDNDKFVLSLELTRGKGIVKGGQLVIEISEVNGYGT